MVMTYEEKKRRISLSHHNLTLENWDELLREFNGCCWFCGFNPVANGDNNFRALHIDHNHSCCHLEYSGRNGNRGSKSCGECIRGLLCRHCNLMMAGYENCKGTMPEILEIEKWINRTPFIFSTPLYHQAKTKGLYVGQKRYDR